MIHELIPIQLEGSLQDAKLYTYLWNNSCELNDGLRRPLVIICPGGAYALTSDREAEALALKFMVMGYHAAVLRYSVAPATYPTALLQLGKAISIIRKRANEWYVDSDKIVVQGSSAGGHLAASLGVFWKEEMLSEVLHVESDILKPNGLILSYPVITSKEFAHRDSFRNLLGAEYDCLVDKMSLEDQVNKDTPKTFIWHTYTDRSVPVENSLLFVQALRTYKISTEFHMFKQGEHGLGTAGKLTASKDGEGVQVECECWMDLAKAWMQDL